MSIVRVLYDYIHYCGVIFGDITKGEPHENNNFKTLTSRRNLAKRT
jgi:hypothetical protein